MSAAHTASAAVQAQAFPELLPDLSSVLNGLMARARENLTYEDLRHLAAMGERAERLVRQIGELCTGVGCLVAADKDAGNFREPDDVASLLFAIAALAENAEAFLTLEAAAENWQFIAGLSEGGAS